MKIQRLHKQIHVLFLLLAVAVISACDAGGILDIDREMLDIELETDAKNVNIGDTTTINAHIDYSGDAAALVYEWDTNGGRIVGDGTSIIFVAPETAGTYTITLEVSDGSVSEQTNIQIQVDLGHAIVTMPNRYWQGTAFTQTLSFRLNVEELFRENITLRYEILQDTAQAGAFLSIAIDGTSVIQDKRIGSVQPAQMMSIADDVDVFSIISEPGNYELTLSLEIVNVMEDAWLLQKLIIIGAEGTLTEIL